MDDQLMKLGVTLAEVTARNTISFVSGKMQLAKETKNMEEQSLAYTEIINNLLADKEELTTIAREYKQELDNVVISDKDIEYLHSTLNQFIFIMVSMTPDLAGKEELMSNFVELLNKDTLKTMQLLGFNYKEAIGIPLTEVCSDMIRRKLGSGSKTGQSSKKSKK